MRLDFWRGHPPGLAVCFLTEMWERFSYYGMRALLIFYLTQHFLYSDEKAYLIYGAYTAMVYMLPVIGGILADQYLGYRKAVTFGAVLLVLGHFGLAIEGPSALTIVGENGLEISRDPFYANAFFLSLALIATGVGFLKTNVSTIVGALYDKGDPRRDSGFTFFYMGINIGGALAPLLCGWLGQTYGWQYGFGLAGIGMLGGLIVFVRGQKYLEGRAEPPCPEKLRKKIVLGLSLETLVYFMGVFVVLGAWVLLMNQALVGRTLSLFGLGASLFVLYFATRRSTREERDKIIVISVLLIFLLIFFAFYEQMGSSLNLFADRVVNRDVLSVEVPASTLQSLPAFFVILLAPVFSIMWIWLGRRGLEPTTPVKFALGLFFMSLAFFTLVLGAGIADGEKVSLIFFVLSFFWLVVGELFLSPVGLSMITRLSPQRIMGLMIGMFFLAYSGASFIAGRIAQLAAAPPKAAGDLVVMTQQYSNVYYQLGILAIGTSVFLYILTPILARAMHEEGTGNRTIIARLYPKKFRKPIADA